MYLIERILPVVAKIFYYLHALHTNLYRRCILKFFSTIQRQKKALEICPIVSREASVYRATSRPEAV